MANQQAKRDDNRVPGLIIHDSTGAETRQVRATSGNPNAVPVDIVGGGTGASAGQVQGTAADAATAVGNPVDVALEYLTSAPTLTNGQHKRLQGDINANLKTVEQYVPVYEDNDTGKAVVEHRYTPSYKLTADTLVKTGAGLLRSATFTCNDAAPTAGSIIIFDNTAESGSELFNHTFTTTPFAPFTVTFDTSVATGIYVGFTTTADVNVFLSYR